MLVKITTKHARNSLVTSVTRMQFAALLRKLADNKTKIWRQRCDVIFPTKLSRSKKLKKSLFFFNIKKDENCQKA